MKLGFRAKFFVAGVALVALANLASGLYLDFRLSGWLRHRIEEELLAHARVAVELLRRVPASTSVAQLDRLADRMGQATKARVTVIAPKGRVLGDSQIDLQRLQQVESHLDRPEIRAARLQGKGVARRQSKTLGQEMVYVALRYRPDGSTVRISRPLAHEREVLAGMRWLLLITGLLTLLAVILLAAYGSRALSRTLRELVDNSRAILTGQARRINVQSRDEIAHLAGSFNILAEELESNVGQLATERAKMGAVLEGMSESLVALDDEHRVTLVNDAALKLIGLEASPLGKPLEQVMPIEGLRELVDDATAEQVTREFKIRGGEGNKRWLVVTAAPLVDDGRVVVLYDMTEVRRLEGMRRNFVANVSHELRTPVSIIRANTETLLDGAMDDPKAARRFLEAVLRHTERLSRIISDLLDISRVEAGRYHFEFGSLKLRKTVRGAVALMRESAERKQIQVRIDVQKGIRLRADSGALEQILFNLLENAIKYTSERGAVTVRASQDDQHTEIEVIDDGVGVPIKHRSRLFERFYRVDRGRSRDMGGTGLGLAIVKHLAEAHGGEAGMRPCEPNGSNFWVRLPNEPVLEAPEPDVE
jgi:two-component system phosphate regulon sensor histidine kinase PhoR